MGVVSPILYADVAILDATFTQGLPAILMPQQVLMRWCMRLRPTHPLSEEFFMPICWQNALQLLNHNLAKVLKWADLEARQNMLVGSMLAGQAFANAPVVRFMPWPIHSVGISICHMGIAMHWFWLKF